MVLLTPRLNLLKGLTTGNVDTYLALAPLCISLQLTMATGATRWELEGDSHITQPDPLPGSTSGVNKTTRPPLFLHHPLTPTSSQAWEVRKKFSELPQSKWQMTFCAYNVECGLWGDSREERQRLFFFFSRGFRVWLRMILFQPSLWKRHIFLPIYQGLQFWLASSNSIPHGFNNTQIGLYIMKWIQTTDNRLMFNSFIYHTPKRNISQTGISLWTTLWLMLILSMGLRNVTHLSRSWFHYLLMHVTQTVYLIHTRLSLFTCEMEQEQNLQVCCQN